MTAVAVPGFDLPVSDFLSQQSRRQLDAYRAALARLAEDTEKKTPKGTCVAQVRQAAQRALYASDLYRDLLDTYPVDVAIETIGGVDCEVFRPITGIRTADADKVLINCHGGAFVDGSRTFSRLESIPICAVSELKVVSVDYRLAPEHRYPSATEDAVAVYRALEDQPGVRRIAVFGSSAGASLAAQMIAALHGQGRALPSSAAMLFGGASMRGGDSVAIGGAILAGQTGADVGVSNIGASYYADRDPRDPWIAPGLNRDRLCDFPPVVLAGASRDFLLSNVIETHRRLRAVGVEADLHLWDGLGHCFHYNPYLDESRELHEAVVSFLRGHLDRPDGEELT